MIVSFGTKDTERIWVGEFVKRIQGPIQEVARRKLRMLNSAQTITDLRVPPANRLVKLKGDLVDYWSIRINDQWRVIFQWKDGQASNVEIIDYH